MLIIEKSYPSGSNTKILYDSIKDKYNVTMVHSNDIFFERRNLKDYIKFIKMMLHVSKYHYVITTHGFIKYNPKQIVIDLWHGIPMKAMAFMEKDKTIYPSEKFNADYLITNSKLDSVLMGACTHLPFSKHKILGSPRVDYLYQKSVKSIFNMEQYNKVILYMPTFRQGYQGRKEGEIFEHLIPVKYFNLDKFERYLEEKSYLLLIKLHPLEEGIAEKKLNFKSRNLRLVQTEELLQKGLDIYELLPSIDLLITDYSSVYLDFLILNRPIVFINYDLRKYSDVRGLLLEPYHFWTPGFEVKSFNDLIWSINNSFTDDPFQNKRLELRNLFHKYQDGKSTERVIHFLEKLMKIDK